MLVVPAVVCANRVARGISEMVKGKSYMSSTRTVAPRSDQTLNCPGTSYRHTEPIPMFMASSLSARCETLRAQDAVADIKKACPYKPVHLIIIQDEGGSVKATAEGASVAP